MNQLLTRSWDYHKKLTSQMEKSSDHVEILKKFLNDIQIANEQYAKTLKQVAEDFYQGVSSEIIENEVLLCCYNYICHFVLNMSHHHTNAANDIQNKIIEPFQLFSDNFKETNKVLLKNGQNLIEDLENSKIELIKTQDRYYKKAKEADKFIKQNESMIKKAENNKKANEESNYYLYELKQRQLIADESCKDYLSHISIVNKQWENFDTSFYSIFDDFGLNDESRVHFTKLSISQMIKTLQEYHAEIYTAMNDYSMQNFENKMKLLEEATVHRKGHSQNIIDALDFNEVVRLTKREEFVPYDALRKSNLQKKSSSSKSGSQYQKENIDSFLALILHNLKDKVESDDSLFSMESSMNESVATAASLDEESKFAEMLSTPSLRRHFLERVILRTKDIPECSISRGKWEKLITCSSVFLQSVTKEELADPELSFNILSFVTKFSRDVVGFPGKKKYLGSQLKNREVWKEPGFWDNLTYYLLHRRKLEEFNKAASQPLAVNSNNENEKEEKSKSFMHGFKKKFEGLMDTNKNPKIDEDSLKALIMDEINNYVARLKLDQTTRSRVILETAKRLGLDTVSIESIKSELEKDGNIEAYNRVNNRTEIHKRKIEKKGRKLYAVYLALDFLSYNDNLVDIMLVNREWKKKLSKKLFKLRLSEIDEKITVQTRLKVWKSILKLDQIRVDYFKIKERFNLVEQNVFPVEDIITMDVQRSFHNNPNINTMILYNLLRLYAHYDQKVSYCQGMNYIMGFLYCQFKDEDLAFNFFVAVINKYMKQLFENDLISLKTAFYQLDRLVGIFLPDLAKVFKREGVDASFFSASWFITMFTNVYQYSDTSYTLMRIWDLFLLEGWKGLFKVAIYVLGIYRERLLHLRFDQLLSFVNELTAKEFFTNFKYNESLQKSKQFSDFFDYQPYEEEKPIRFFARKIDDVHITKELLKSLEEEYHVNNPPKVSTKPVKNKSEDSKT